MTQPQSILIIGNGIAGTTLASFLLLSSLPASQKPHITILERASSLRAQGQNVDIRGAGVTIIRKLGLEGLIRASTTREEGVQLVDKNNVVWGAFGADKSGKVQTATSDIEILRGPLTEICYKRCKSISEEVKAAGGHGVEFIFGDYTAEIDQDGEKVEVRFAKSGEQRRFDLVVGADGLQSKTRNLVWGPEGEEERIWRTGAYGPFWSMPASPTDSLWRRFFHAAGRKGIMVRPSDRSDLTTVFMAIVNEEKDPRFRAVAAQGHQGVPAQKALMQEYFHHEGWECDRILREMQNADDFYYDMIAQVHMDNWSKGRVVLAGDAGYCASPISGMGTTLALNGAYVLAGALVQHPRDYTAAFSQYQQQMRPVVTAAQKLPPGLPHLMFPATGWGVWTMHLIASAIWWTGLDRVVFRLKGHPADEVPVEDFGLGSLDEGYVERA